MGEARRLGAGVPEGDTLFKVAAFLAPRLVGQTLVGGFAGWPRTELAGRRIEGVHAHGKHLFLTLDDGRAIRSHLGMWGAWHRYPKEVPWQKPERQARILLDLGAEVYVCFNPLEVEVLRSGGVRAQVLAVRLGPDLLAHHLDLAGILGRVRELADPEALIADVLLDQRLAAGIGNIYKSEVLFLAGLLPSTRLRAVGEERIAALYRLAQRLLAENRGPGPRTTRRSPDGSAPLWVYGRRGQPCLRCGTPVRYARLGQHHRATYWCAACQPALGVASPGCDRS